jgi:ABC-2 type transport system ATP-binding protein
MNELVIQAKNLTKRFGDFVAVNDISFEVQKGEIFGFLGANGAGKTTAMRILCGLSTPTSGYAAVAGIDVKKDPEAVKKRIGYMSQKFSLYEDLTVGENIRFYGGVYGLSNKQIREKRSSLLERLGMEKEEKKLVHALPLGWRQKLAFSVAILHDPQVVFLDEPTGGVDPANRKQFWSMIYETADSGMTVFVTTHYMDEAEYCNRISIMVDGKIAEMGRPADVKKKYKAERIDDVFYQLARGASRAT